MTIKDIYKYALENLKDKEERYIDTEILLSYILKKDRLYIKLNLDEEITDIQEKLIKENIELLKNDMPIHYITGIRDFYGNDFFVEKNVLIPRSDTEILVDEAIKNIKKYFTGYESIKGLEIGAGSGIISISLLKNIKNLNMTCVDVNPDAIRLTKRNAENLEVLDRICVLNSDIYENISDKYDFIISNPPYIDTKQMQNLPDKVKKHEPHLALDGKEDGLYFYENIIKNSQKYLKNKYFLFFEIGYNQSEEIKSIFDSCEMKSHFEVVQDLNKLDRVIIYRNFEV